MIFVFLFFFLGGGELDEFDDDKQSVSAMSAVQGEQGSYCVQ